MHALILTAGREMRLQNGRVQKETNTSFDRLFEIEKEARFLGED